MVVHMKKTYTARSIATWGDNREFRAYSIGGGAIEFRKKSAPGRLPHLVDPTPEDWHALALALTVTLDSLRQTDEDCVEMWQSADDKAAAMAEIIEGMAEHAEMQKCCGCKLWVASEHGHDFDDGWFCEGCQDDWDPACSCGGGGCMRCIGVPRTGPIP